MGLEEALRARLAEALDRLVSRRLLDRAAVRSARMNVEPPRRGGSGDVATNAALVLAKAAGKPPRELGTLIAEQLRIVAEREVERVEVAGPGFLNVTLKPAAFLDVMRELLRAGPTYGRGPAATRERANVEFVSANPTGPLLISHGRGAVIGDVVARLMEATGYRVTREYYLNDFGNQVRLLAESVRCKIDGREPPEGGYGGCYVAELSSWIAQHAPESLRPGAEAELVRQCILHMLEGIPGSDLLGIRPTLCRLGVSFDVWSSEEALHRWGRVQRTLEELRRRGRLQRGDDGAVFFVTGEQDDQDRVVCKSDGTSTYFAGDIAYHDDKLARGFERVIDVWGADHHGYVPRLRSAIEALGHPAGRFEVLLYQLVSLVRDGREVRMGKRLGNLITLQEVMEEIDEAVGNPHAGRDALRFFFLSRRVDTPIVLDVELAKKQKQENPVYYIQYGHARLCSILRKARDKFGLEVPPFSDRLAAQVTHPLELGLLAQLGRFPAVVEEAASSREPHKLVCYLQSLAFDFQSYYTQLGNTDPILPRDSDLTEGWAERWNHEKTLGRLLWIEALRTVYQSGLELLGIDAPEQMRRASAESEESGAEPAADGSCG
jgi:arginyl-tRNA synthetase